MLLGTHYTFFYGFHRACTSQPAKNWWQTSIQAWNMTLNQNCVLNQFQPKNKSVCILWKKTNYLALRMNPFIFWLALEYIIYLHLMHMHIYIYIYVCVCVCVSVRERETERDRERETERARETERETERHRERERERERERKRVCVGVFVLKIKTKK